jgi:hypothetical protein
VDFFLNRKNAASDAFTTVNSQLMTAYHIHITFFFGFGLDFQLDWTGDPKYTAALNAKNAAANLWQAAVDSSQGALADQTALSNEITRITGLRDQVAAALAASQTNLSDLQITLNQQYRFLRDLSRVAIGVLSDTRGAQAGATFGTASSLISEVQSYTNTYTVSSESIPAGEFVDLPALARRLKQPARAFDTWVVQQLSPATITALANYQGASSDPTALLTGLVQDFNQILQGPSIYDAQRFAGVVLRAETQALLAQNPQGDYLVHLNRLLTGHPRGLQSATGTLAFPAGPFADIMILEMEGAYVWTSICHRLLGGRYRTWQRLSLLLVARGRRQAQDGITRC